MNNQTKQVIEYCTQTWKLIFINDMLKSGRTIINLAQNMTDDFIEWDNNQVDWDKVEDVISEKIYELNYD